MALDLEQHLLRCIAFSRGANRAGDRTQDVLCEIHKELDAIEAANNFPEEWAVVVALALEGLARSVPGFSGPAPSSAIVAAAAVRHILVAQDEAERTAAMAASATPENFWPSYIAGMKAAADLCAVSPQQIAEGDWTDEGKSMAAMIRALILNQARSEEQR